MFRAVGPYVAASIAWLKLFHLRNLYLKKELSESLFLYSISVTRRQPGLGYSGGNY
jgi:hypothetical protein